MSDTFLVFSHLRWNFVYQRPQHLMKRMAMKRRIIFFEEPIQSKDSEIYLELSHPEKGITVCTPHTPSLQVGYHEEQMPYLNVLLHQLIKDEQVSDYLVWVYTPMALPLVQALRPRLLVYDCMDELSGFMKAPKELVQRERELLRTADLVFTGGPSLYQAKKELNPAVHCFPSSVDAPHFAQAVDPALDHPSQLQLPRPRLGYFGVLDERLDLELIHELAVNRPDWQIILVGPVLKIAPETLPQLPNITYFGQQEYADLPAFLAGWDVCLLPFALNSATRFISPTKTLEYMAAQKPVVSTPITDVARPYGEIVLIADSASCFIAACERALALTGDERQRMLAAMQQVLSRTSWDHTVQQMDALIDKTLSQRIYK
jgi:glycosyltransferase involved in cell wall biosynthesis